MGTEDVWLGAKEVCRRCPQPAEYRVHFGTFYYEDGTRISPRPDSLPEDLMWLACEQHCSQVENDLMDAYPEADGVDSIPLYQQRMGWWRRLTQPVATWWWNRGFR